MGYWEASQHPPRHPTHHHRRRHRAPDESNSNIKSHNTSRLKHPRRHLHHDSTLLDLNHASQQQTRLGAVENWLEQTAKQTPHPQPSTSQGHRSGIPDSDDPSRPFDATSPYNKHPRPVDPRWSSRHDFPYDSLHQSGSPFKDLGLGDRRRSSRKRDGSSDSSFISGFENSTKPPDYNIGSIQQQKENIPPARSPREAGPASLSDSSVASYVGEKVNYEKRPRRKTREDKYETRKEKRHRQQEDAINHDDHRRKKRKKAEKRKSKAGISSKNVMSNFTSAAVLNERITVQPHLKPGLFDNARASKKQPIPDLAFSEMHFLKHQKRNPQPKALSKSRLREKQREDREMEEVSAFFLPHGTDGNVRKEKHRSPNAHRDLEYQDRQHTFTRRREPYQPSPPNHRDYSEHIHMPSNHNDEFDTTPIPGSRRSVDDGEESGRHTAYFTWSSSRHSPPPGTRGRRDSIVSDSTRTRTPDSIRKALMATGIYRNTGIPLYDDCLNGQGPERQTIDATSSGVYQAPHHEPDRSRKAKYRDQAVMTEDPPKRPEVPNSSQTSEVQQPSRPREDPSPKEPSAQEVDRQQIARETRLSPIKTAGSRQDVQASNIKDAQAVPRNQNPTLSESKGMQHQQRQDTEANDQASVASRDAMPPPPIPRTINSLSTLSPTNITEAHGGKQSNPSVNELTEDSQAPRVASRDNAIQDHTKLYENQTVINSPSKQADNDESLLSSFDAISWIPQRTPSTRIVEKRHIPSRSYMRTPIFVDQLEEDHSRISYQQDSMSQPQASESMAEFIARIESESQLQSASQNDGITAGSEMGLEEATLHRLPFDMETQNGPYSAFGEEGIGPNLDSKLHIPYSNAGDPGMGVGQYYGTEFHIEAQYPSYETDTHGGLHKAARRSEDLDEEQFEMTGFWRPNRFSQF
ncbi:hypothetical protein M426DRAFT_316719 [Hypoxylon sp. CI-4A]|nr:hypothetical protein M426DRAFT_316719 [Hypoxylon sp. CI-4A]